MFRRSIENYPIYYLTGYLLCRPFTGTTNAAMTTLSDNRSLLLKVKFPMELFIITRGCTALVNLGYSAAYGVMLVVFQIPVSWPVVFLPFIVACLFLFSLGLSYALAAAYVFYGDVQHLYTVVLTLWMYCSAIFTGGSVIRANPSGGGDQPLYLCSSGACVGAVMEAQPPSWQDLALMILWGTGAYLAGWGIFRWFRVKLLQRL